MKALVLVFSGLVVWGAVTGKTGAPGAPPTAATEIPTHGGHGTLFGVLVVVGLVALVVKAGGRGRTAGGRMVSGHAHGERRFIARHEAGHAAAARALGGQVISATANDREGLVSARIPNNPRARITFLRAGGHAVRSGRGCQDDRAAERRALREVPWGQRGQVLRDADRDARRIVNQHRGQIRRDARTLEQRGTL